MQGRHGALLDPCVLSGLSHWHAHTDLCTETVFIKPICSKIWLWNWFIFKTIHSSQFRELGYSLESPQKCAGVLVKVGRSQVYYGLDLSSTSWGTHFKSVRNKYKSQFLKESCGRQYYSKMMSVNSLKKESVLKLIFLRKVALRIQALDSI